MGTRVFFRIGWVMGFGGAGALLATPNALASIETVYASLKQKAAQNSYELQAAQATADQKSAALYTAWAAWMPRLDLQLSQARSKDYSFLTSGTLGALAATLTPQTTTLRRWELDLTFPIYRRSVHLGIEQASTESRLYREKAQLLQTELHWKLHSQLGNYLQQIYKTTALDNSITLAKTHLKDAELRFELGQRTKVDVLRAKANLASLQSKKLTYQAEQETALNQLLEYTGLSPSDLHETNLHKLTETEAESLHTLDQFTQTDGILPAVVPFLGSDSKSQTEAAPPSLEEQLATRSLPYANFLTEENLNDRRAKSGMASQWPEFLFRGSLNKQTPTWNETFASGNQSYSLAFLVNIPLFSGGSLLSSYSEKTNAQESNRLQTEKNLLHFKNEVENERIQIRSLLKSLEAQKLNTAQNEEIVRLTFKSYQLGKTTMMELLDSQNDLIDSKIALSKTKTDLSTLIRRFAWNLGVSIP